MERRSRDEAPQGEQKYEVSSPRAYEPPRLEVIGTLSELTFGSAGAKGDMGTKRL